MKEESRVGRIAGIAQIVAEDPGQARFLTAWGRALRQSPLTSRLPWLPFRVIERLEKHLTKGSHVFEFGGGGSTLWFSERAGEVVTVEHDDDWFRALQDAVSEKDNCQVLYHAANDDFAGYVGSIADYADGYFDVVVVDGRERIRCLRSAMEKVRPGGLLILDDSDRARYSDAFVIATAWPHVTYRGLTPAKAIAGVTTVWRRPA
ncbi:class I SAM-dependent methyltransferase [Streptomyces cynarae]|uniref:class I SAM-dependent methyltransferase n=1 Tax=Streptomyces cynarae TaxID=2981134 RepID=UPI00406D1DF2